MKIKFITGGILTQRSQRIYDTVYVNPSYFYMRHFYNLHGKGQDVNWLFPELVSMGTVEEAIDQIVLENPDIIGFGMYVWSSDRQHLIAQGVKKRLPSVTIVMGGPSLVAHKTPGFFSKHPYVDYVVYGDGEKAMQQIIDFKMGLISDENFVNIVTVVDQVEKVYPYERLVDDHYFSTSPYMSQTDYIKDALEYTKDKINNAGVYKGPWTFSIGVEFTRGCMYACSFCDWSQSLTKKVKRRKHDFKNDIDFFHSLNVQISETDANFGMWQEDIELHEYARSLYDPDRMFSFTVTNSPKLNKKATMHFLVTESETYGTPGFISLQDIDENVLKKIDRPSLKWEQHVDFINELKKRMKPEHFERVQAQLMIGIPGQSLETIKNTVAEITLTGLRAFNANHWVLLSNSPAAEKVYQKINKLVFDTFHVLNTPSSSIDVGSIEELYMDASQNVGKYITTIGGQYIVETATMTEIDIKTALAMITEFQRAPNHIKNNKSKDQILKILDRICDATRKRMQKQEELLRPLEKKYGIRIYGYYDDSANKFYNGI